MTTEQRCRRIVSDQVGLGETEITAGSQLVDDLGCDDLDLIEIVMEAESQLGIEITDDAMMPVETFSQFVQLCESLQQAKSTT